VSRKTVQVVRTLVEAFNAGDWDRYFDQLDPDVEWWDRGDDLGATVHRGHEGVRAFLAELAETVELGAQATEFVDTADWVLVCLHLHGRGKASGAEFEEREVHALRLRDGKVVETHEYRTKEQALEAVGLRE
jgi:ketosteroid isomerase-like protein